MISDRLSRRGLLLGASAATLGGVASLPAFADKPRHVQIRSRETSFMLQGQETQGLVSLADNAPPPVIRLRQGQPVDIDYTNGLEDYSTMHWHGIRLPNAMDGVPYLTQIPLGQGETFRYSFTPPDAGTFWYHPHCMTMRQMAQGLTGVLIVEEDKDQGYDADIPLNLKDFRVDGKGGLLPFFTARGAARAGTTGNLRTTNWQAEPVYTVPSGGLIRLRFAVTDTTRVHKLVFPDVAGTIVAWDGQPIEESVPWPTLEAPLLLGPGQRVDVVVRAPEEGGAELKFESLIGKRTLFTVAQLRSDGVSLKRDIRDVQPLPRNPFEHPNLNTGHKQEIVFGWSPDGKGSDNGYCGTSEYTFWSINRTPWPGDAVENTGPLLNLKMGESYILRFRNESPNLHPIHLHGLLFKPLRSNLRRLPANYTDTVLLLKNEVIDVALRADNLGDWAFHCHVIEHQKTGLAGYVHVT